MAIRETYRYTYETTTIHLKKKYHGLLAAMQAEAERLGVSLSEFICESMAEKLKWSKEVASNGSNKDAESATPVPQE